MKDEKINEFYSTVKNMRELQREFFRNRDRATLQESKRIERKVDQMIKDHQRRQIDLFDESN